MDRQDETVRSLERALAETYKSRQEETVRLLRYEYDKAAQYQRRQDETVRRLETAVAEQHSASMARYNV